MLVFTYFNLTTFLFTDPAFLIQFSHEEQPLARTAWQRNK